MNRIMYYNGIIATLRLALIEKKKRENLSYRNIADCTLLSESSIYRFMRGPSYKLPSFNYLVLYDYVFKVRGK